MQWLTQLVCSDCAIRCALRPAPVEFIEHGIDGTILQGLLPRLLGQLQRVQLLRLKLQLLPLRLLEHLRRNHEQVLNIHGGHETTQHFLTAALLRGEEDNARTPSARIALGRTVDIGSGVFDLWSSNLG